ncbi:hypothetical protein ACWGH4_20485 [Streptomyces sp. NPDC054847]|jgi:hypothetical protein
MHAQTDVSHGLDPRAATALHAVPDAGGSAPGGAPSGRTLGVVRAAGEPRQ